MGIIFPLYGPNNPRRCATMTVVATALCFIPAVAAPALLVYFLFEGRGTHVILFSAGTGLVYGALVTHQNYQLVKWALREHGCRSAFRFIWYYVLRLPWLGLIRIAIPLLIYRAVEESLPWAYDQVGTNLEERFDWSRTRVAVIVSAAIYAFFLFFRSLVRYFRQDRPSESGNLVRGQRVGTIAGIGSWLAERRTHRDKTRLDRILAKVSREGGTDKLPPADLAFLVMASKKAKQARRVKR